MAGENEGALGGVEHLDGAVEVGLIVIVAAALGRKFWLTRFPVEFSRSLLRVFGDVNEDGARTSATGDQEGLANGARYVLRFGDHHVVLGDGHGDARDINLLKRVGAQDFAADLAGDADDRRRVQHSGGDTGHHVRCARTGSRHGDTDSTAGARVAIGHMCGALFVAHENVVQLGFAERVIDRKNRSAGITFEHRIVVRRQHEGTLTLVSPDSGSARRRILRHADRELAVDVLLEKGRLEDPDDSTAGPHLDARGAGMMPSCGLEDDPRFDLGRLVGEKKPVFDEKPP